MKSYKGFEEGKCPYCYSKDLNLWDCEVRNNTCFMIYHCDNCGAEVIQEYEMNYVDSEVRKNHRYYLIQRPFTVGAIPNPRKVIDSKEFTNKSFVPIIGQEAWGYVEYDEPLDEETCKHFGLKESYDFCSFLDSIDYSIRGISPFYTEKEESAWIHENDEILAEMADEFKYDIILVRKETEKTGKVETEYFAIVQSFMKVDEFVSELTGKMGIDFGMDIDSPNSKYYINLYNDPFTAKIDGEDFSGYDMEKYVIEDKKFDELPDNVTKYIIKNMQKGSAIIPLPESMYKKSI